VLRWPVRSHVGHWVPVLSVSLAGGVFESDMSLAGRWEEDDRGGVPDKCWPGDFASIIVIVVDWLLAVKLTASPMELRDGSGKPPAGAVSTAGESLVAAGLATRKLEVPCELTVWLCRVWPYRHLGSWSTTRNGSDGELVTFRD
jgi:hypothetical protein